MSAAQSLDFVSFEQYVRMENAAPVRHEYVGGRLRPMAGAAPEHNDIVDNLSAAFHGRLKNGGCRGSINDQRVQIEETGDTFYPDYLIKCPPYQFSEKDRLALLNPGAIFEVASKTTAEFDRTEKFDLYSLIPECLDYVLITANRVHVVHYHREPGGAWGVRTYVLRSQELRLEKLGISVPLAEIYDRIEVPEGMYLVESGGAAE